MKTVFITGITGFLGSYFAKEALSRGDKVVGLVRPLENMLAEERVEDTFGRDSGIEVVEGDVREDDLGLGRAQLTDLRERVKEIWHFAGLTSFDEHRKDEIEEVNYTGTVNVVGFASGVINLDFLAHISTAYVCGDIQGVVYEDDFSTRRTFRNTYEESKYLAERAVHRSDIKHIIFKPSVVVGDSRTGETPCFNMVYIPWAGVHLAKKRYTRDKDVADGETIELPLKIVGNPDATLNIIPIDYVVDMMSQLGRRENIGKTYHLANPDPTTMGELLGAISSALNVEGVEYVPTLAKDNELNALERLYLSRTGPYQQYMLTNDPVFDMTNSGGLGARVPKPDQAFLHRLIQYGMENNWGR